MCDLLSFFYQKEKNEKRRNRNKNEIDVDNNELCLNDIIGLSFTCIFIGDNGRYMFDIYFH